MHSEAGPTNQRFDREASSAALCEQSAEDIHLTVETIMATNARKRIADRMGTMSARQLIQLERNLDIIAEVRSGDA